MRNRLGLTAADAEYFRMKVTAHLRLEGGMCFKCSKCTFLLLVSRNMTMLLRRDEWFVDVAFRR